MTVRSYTSRLLAFLRWLAIEGYTPPDLSAKLKKPKATQKLIQQLSPDETAKLIDSAKADSRCGVRNLAILYVMLDSGPRASEVCGLRPSGVLWDQRLIKVLGKGNKKRVVPISSVTSLAMRRYLMSAERHEDRAETFSKLRKVGR
jgi:site-specific recombinase XerD